MFDLISIATYYFLHATPTSGRRDEQKRRGRGGHTAVPNVDIDEAEGTMGGEGIFCFIISQSVFINGNRWTNNFD